MEMKYVYFGDDFNRRAPELFGHTCTEPDAKWVTLPDIGLAMQAGHSISIRPASESEMKRAEAVIALRSVGYEMAKRIDQLLDQQGAAVVHGAITRVRDALESIEGNPALQLLDQKSTACQT